MTYQIAYGIDTESIEDPDQIVLLTMPDECADMDSEALIDHITDHWNTLRIDPMVGVYDVLESVQLAMTAHGIPETTINSIITTVTDAIDNNA